MKLVTSGKFPARCRKRGKFGSSADFLPHVPSLELAYMQSLNDDSYDDVNDVEDKDGEDDDSDDDVDGDDLHMCHHMFLHMHTLHQTHTWRLHYLSSGCDDDDDDDDGYDDDYHNYDDSEGETKPQRVLPLFQLNQICFSFKHASNQQSSGPKLLVQYILNIFIKIVHFNFDHFL